MRMEQVAACARVFPRYLAGSIVRGRELHSTHPLAQEFGEFDGIPQGNVTPSGGVRSTALSARPGAICALAVPSVGEGASGPTPSSAVPAAASTNAGLRS